MKIDEQWVKDNPKEALDLPVKFKEWCDKGTPGMKEIYPSNKDAYKYWIDNIYKPE